MGRALSSWERAAREREKERSQARAADARRRERAEARREREREREQRQRERTAEREARQREREMQKEAKETAKREFAESQRAEAATSQAYLDALSRLHCRPFSLASFHAELTSRSTPRTFPSNRHEPVSFSEPYPEGRFEPQSPPTELPFGQSPRAARARRVPTLAGAVGGVVALVGVGADAVATCSVLAVLLFLASLPFYVKKRSAMLAEFEAERVSELAEFEANERRRRDAFDAALTTSQSGWSARKAEHESKEALRRRLFVAWEDGAQREALDAEMDRIEILTKAHDGDEEALMIMIEATLPVALHLPPPEDFDGPCLDECEVASRVVDGLTVELVVIAPDLDIVPRRHAELNPAGDRVKYKALNEKFRAERYDGFIASLALANAARVFEVMPWLRTVRVECGTMAIDRASGERVERVLLRTEYLAPELDRIQLQHVDPVEVLSRFISERVPVASKKSLTPQIDRSAVTWASRDDDPEDVPPGLLPEPTPIAWPTNPYAGPSALCEATTLRICPHGNAPFRTITDALRAARPGATLWIAPGTYTEALLVDKAVHLIGEGEPGQVRVVAADRRVLVTRGELVEVTNLVLDGATEGAQLGSVNVDAGMLVLRGSYVLPSSGEVTIAGAVSPAGYLEAHDSLFEGALVGVSARGRVLLTGCTIRRNRSGGVMVFARGNATFDGCVFQDNQPFDLSVDRGARARLVGCSFGENAQMSWKVEEGAILETDTKLL